MDLVDKGMRYFTAKKDYKLPVEKILNTLSNDDNFIDKVSDMVEAKKGIDNTTADKIVKLPNVQSNYNAFPRSRSTDQLPFHHVSDTWPQTHWYNAQTVTRYLEYRRPIRCL